MGEGLACSERRNSSPVYCTDQTPSLPAASPLGSHGGRKDTISLEVCHGDIALPSSWGCGHLEAPPAHPCPWVSLWKAVPGGGAEGSVSVVGEPLLSHLSDSSLPTPLFCHLLSHRGARFVVTAADSSLNFLGTV